MSQRHTLAVQARIMGAPSASRTSIGRLYKDNGELPQLPAAVIYPGNGTDTSDRLSGPRVRENPSWTIHFVGTSWAQVSAMTESVKAQFFVDGYPVPWNFEGETISNQLWAEPIPIQYDTDVNPPLAYQVVELSFTAEPS